MKALNKSYWGYCRVSSQEQKNNYSLENQITQLRDYGVPPNQIKTEVISGESVQRPVLDELEKEMPPNTFLIVTDLDRFARSTIIALNRIHRMRKEKNIQFLPLNLESLCLSSDSAVMDLAISVFFSLAQYENENRRKKQKAGIELAKRNNKYKGRKTVLTPSILKKIEDNYKKDISLEAISKICNISIPSVYKGLSKLHVVKRHNRPNPAFEN